MPKDSTQKTEVNPSKDVDNVSAVKSDFFKDTDIDQTDVGASKQTSSSQDAGIPETKTQESTVASGVTKEQYDAIIAQNKVLADGIKQMQTMFSTQQQQSQKQKEEEMAPKDIFEAVGVEKDDFVFDSDEAITNPESDSGKVFRGLMLATIGPVLEKQKNEIVGTVQNTFQQQAQQKNIADFRSKAGLQDDQLWTKFISDINKQEFTIEDAYQVWAMKNGIVAPNQIGSQNINPTMGQMLGGNMFNPTNVNPNFNSFPQQTRNVQSAYRQGNNQPTLAEILGEM